MTIVNLMDTKVKRKLSLVLGAASLALLMQAPVWAMQQQEAKGPTKAHRSTTTSEEEAERNEQTRRHHEAQQGGHSPSMMPLPASTTSHHALSSFGEPLHSMVEPKRNKYHVDASELSRSALESLAESSTSTSESSASELSKDMGYDQLNKAMVDLEGGKILEATDSLDHALAMYTASVENLDNVQSQMTAMYSLLSKTLNRANFDGKDKFLEWLVPASKDIHKLEGAEAYPEGFKHLLEGVIADVQKIESKEEWGKYKLAFAQMKSDGTAFYSDWLKEFEVRPEKEKALFPKVARNITRLINSQKKEVKKQESARRRDARSRAKEKVRELEIREAEPIFDQILAAQTILLTLPRTVKIGNTLSVLEMLMHPEDRELYLKKAYFQNLGPVVDVVTHALQTPTPQVLSQVGKLLGSASDLVDASVYPSEKEEREEQSKLERAHEVLGVNMQMLETLIRPQHQDYHPEENQELLLDRLDNPEFFGGFDVHQGQQSQYQFGKHTTMSAEDESSEEFVKKEEKTPVTVTTGKGFGRKTGGFAAKNIVSESPAERRKEESYHRDRQQKPVETEEPSNQLTLGESLLSGATPEKPGYGARKGFGNRQQPQAASKSTSQVPESKTTTSQVIVPVTPNLSSNPQQGSGGTGSSQPAAKSGFGAKKGFGNKGDKK